MSIWDLIPGIGKIAEAGIDYGINSYALNKRKKQVKGMDYSKTPEGLQLLKESQQGDISPEEQADILTRTGIQSGAATSAGKAAYAGRMAASGMGGSIAAQRGMNEYDTTNAQTMGNMAGNIDLENAKSKAEASSRYASGAQAYSAQRRAQLDEIDQQNQQNNLGLVSGLLGGGVSLAGGITSGMARKAGKDAWSSGDISKMTPDMAGDFLGIQKTQAEINKLNRPVTPKTSSGSGSFESAQFQTLSNNIENANDETTATNIYNTIKGMPDSMERANLMSVMNQKIQKLKQQQIESGYYGFGG